MENINLTTYRNEFVVNTPLVRGLRTISLHAALPLLFILCLWTNQNCVCQEIASHDATLLDKIKPKVDYTLDSDGNVVSISAKGTTSGFDAFGKFRSLRDLSIDGYGGDGLNDLSQLSALKRLSLSDHGFTEKKHTCPLLPTSLESLDLKLLRLDPENTLAIVRNLTNLTSLSLPAQFFDEHILRLNKLNKLDQLQLIYFDHRDSYSFSSCPPSQPEFCFQLLVDLQGRSINEACDVLGPVSYTHLTLPTKA